MKKLASFLALVFCLTTMLTFSNFKNVHASTIYRGTYSYKLHKLTKYYTDSRSSQSLPSPPRSDIKGTVPPSNATILNESTTDSYVITERGSNYYIGDIVTQVTIEYEVQVH